MTDARTAVVDASALIALAQIGRLDLLPALFAKVAAPPEVARESMPTIRSVPDWLAVVATERGDSPACALPLGPGERAAIGLALRVRADVFVSDDGRARRCAASAGLAVRGCAGIAVDAKQRGLIDSARPMIDELVAAGLWLGADVYSAAVREAGEDA